MTGVPFKFDEIGYWSELIGKPVYNSRNVVARFHGEKGASDIALRLQRDELLTG
jgi:hypothetical protein